MINQFQQIAAKGGKFVEYPTQAGALFQFALDVNDTGYSAYYRRAYTPAETPTVAQFVKESAFPALWDGGSITYHGLNFENVAVYKTTFEVCPKGYRRPTDGASDRVVFNGPYIYPGQETAVDYSNEIANSELRVSLFNMPFAGNASSNSDYNTIWGGKLNSNNSGNGTYPIAGDDAKNPRKRLKGTKLAFYADGFFDRRPIMTRRYGKASEKTYAVFDTIDQWADGKIGYHGVLYFNPETNASIFLPAAGRLNNEKEQTDSNGTKKRVLEGVGSTGFYWSSTAGPRYFGDEYSTTLYDSKGENPTDYNRQIQYGAWVLESNSNAHTLLSTYPGFGNSIRCVKE